MIRIMLHDRDKSESLVQEMVKLGVGELIENHGGGEICCDTKRRFSSVDAAAAAQEPETSQPKNSPNAQCPPGLS